MTSPAPKLSLEELASQYGYAAAFFNIDQELKSLITSAVAEQWTADKFRAKLMATQWYRTRSASVRQFLELEARDPNEALQRINNKMSVIKAKANKMGVSITADRLKQIARDSIIWEYPDEKLTEAIAAEWKYTAGGGTAGGAATLEDTVRKNAADYGITLSQQQVQEWVGGALAGKYTEDHLNDFARDMARSRYPGATQWLDQGMTVRQIAAPYIQSYSTVLEQGTDTVDLQDPHIQQALQGVYTQDGKPPAMQTVYEFEKGLRKDPRWTKTKNAQTSMMNATQQVLRDFGIVG